MRQANNRILLVDDEEDILEFLSYNLLKSGYVLETAKNGKEALLKALVFHPDLIILDIMMPEMDGIEACHELRQKQELKNTVIAFLTARTEDYSQIAGFEAGGDDFIKKPIRPNVFLSRVKALLRRKSNHLREDSVIVLEDLLIDKDKYLVIKNGKNTQLPKKEFELLYFLTTRPNKVFSREEIYNKVWGNEVIVGERTIDVHIKKIREKIGFNNIKTFKGIGYSYCTPVFK